MTRQFVFTLAGTDRIGIVNTVTQIILQYSGNVESSKMAHLGHEFAMLVMVSCPDNQYENLKIKLMGLQDEGFQVIIRQTTPDTSGIFKGWLPYRIKVHGADNEGIVHNMTHVLSKNGINIETMDTAILHAPMSGTPLFSMTAVIVVPPDLPFKTWRETLDLIAVESNIALEITSYTGE